jgi:hypothetical protein
MHYITFCEFVRNADKMPPPLPPKQEENYQPAPPSSRPQRQPGIIRAESKTFPDPRTMNPNDSY